MAPRAALGSGSGSGSGSAEKGREKQAEKREEPEGGVQACSGVNGGSDSDTHEGAGIMDTRSDGASELSCSD